MKKKYLKYNNFRIFNIKIGVSASINSYWGFPLILGVNSSLVYHINALSIGLQSSGAWSTLSERTLSRANALYYVSPSLSITLDQNFNVSGFILLNSATLILSNSLTISNGGVLLIDGSGAILNATSSSTISFDGSASLSILQTSGFLNVGNLNLKGGIVSFDSSVFLLPYSLITFSGVAARISNAPTYGVNVSIAYSASLGIVASSPELNGKTVNDISIANGIQFNPVAASISANSITLASASQLNLAQLSGSLTVSKKVTINTGANFTLCPSCTLNVAQVEIVGSGILTRANRNLLCPTATISVVNATSCGGTGSASILVTSQISSSITYNWNV